MSLMTLCRYAECGNDITEDESLAYPGYCGGCAEEVVAFQPNGDKDDEWFFLVNEGSFVDDQFDVSNGDQCGECGNVFYRAYANDTIPGISVICVGGDYGDQFVDGCGSAKPVRLMPSYQVIF